MNRLPRVLPPMIAVVSIIAMIVPDVVVPIATVVPAPFSYGGAFLLATGATMIAWSRRAFQAAGTPIKPFSESTALIRHGLYRWSRNPMYVGAVLLLTGVAILLGVSPRCSSSSRSSRSSRRASSVRKSGSLKRRSATRTAHTGDQSGGGANGL